MVRFLSALILTTLLVPMSAEARQFFRYMDDDGQVVINSSIPPEFVRRGYEIVDDKGVVLRIVDPQLSDEEIRRRASEEERAQNERARDAELSRMYRNPIDVDRAMRTWLSRLDMEIRLKNNRISILRSEFNDLQAEAANLERAGRDIDVTLLANMSRLEEEITVLREEIEEIEDRQSAARDRFQVERERMKVIFERQQGRPWVEPENSN